MKKLNIKYLLATIITSIGFTLASASDTFAKYAITISPTSQRVILTPGESYRGSVRVTNPATSDEDLNYIVSLGSYSVNKANGSLDDYGNADIEAISNYNAIINWIAIDKTSGILAPNEEETITFTVNVPKDAPAGGQYATILVASDNTNNATEGSMNVSENIQMASVIYAEVAGETREIGKIEENNIPSFLLSSPLEATSLVKNNGNVHTDAEYTLQVWPMFSSEEFCTNEEEPETSLVLPDTERYHTQTCSLPLVGIFRAKQTVKIFGEESIVEKTIIVCPIWLLFIIIFVVFALIIWLVLRAKTRKTKTKKED